MTNKSSEAPNSRGKELGDLSLPAELLSRLRHELLTPMISLQGFAEILLTRDISEPQKHRYLKIIHQEAHRLVELVEEMLSADD